MSRPRPWAGFSPGRGARSLVSHRLLQRTDYRVQPGGERIRRDFRRSRWSAGTGDDVQVPGGTLPFRNENNAVVLNFSPPLPDGLYGVLLTTNVTDLAGNHLASPYAWFFHVGNATFWARLQAGSWTDLANWSSGIIPPANENVV